jgi:hypothetical protein
LRLLRLRLGGFLPVPLLQAFWQRRVLLQRSRPLHELLVRGLFGERPLAQQLDHVVSADDLLLQQPLCHDGHFVLVLGQQGGGPLVRLVDQIPDFDVDHLGRALRVRLLQHHLPLAGHVEADVSDFIVHAVVHHLGVGALGDLLQVVLGPRRDPVEEQLLRDSAPERHAHPVEELLFRVQVLVFGEVLSVAQALASRDDRHLEQRVRVLEEPAGDCVPRLVVRDRLLLFWGQHVRFFLHARDHALDRLLEVLHVDRVVQVPRGDQRRLVAHVGDVGAGESRRQGRHLPAEVVLVQSGLQGAQVDPEDAGAPLDVGGGDEDLPVEAARPQQGLVEDVYPVGGGQHHHVGRGVEAVHLHQELIQCVLLLGVAPEAAASAFPPHRVDLIYEENAGGVLASHREQVSHPGGAHSHKHLQELGPGDCYEGDVGFAGGRLRQKSLSGARRTWPTTTNNSDNSNLAPHRPPPVGRSLTHL